MKLADNNNIFIEFLEFGFHYLIRNNIFNSDSDYPVQILFTRIVDGHFIMLCKSNNQYKRRIMILLLDENEKVAPTGKLLL